MHWPVQAEALCPAEGQFKSVFVVFLWVKLWSSELRDSPYSVWWIQIQTGFRRMLRAWPGPCKQIVSAKPLAGDPEPSQSRDTRTLTDWTSGILGLVSSNQFERCSLCSLGAVSYKLVIANKTERNWQRGFLESPFLYFRWSRNRLITNCNNDLRFLFFPKEDECENANWLQNETLKRICNIGAFCLDPIFSFESFRLSAQ